MPYIKKEHRYFLDKSINRVIERLRDCELDIYHRPGPTNYVITRIVVGSLKPIDGWTYHSLSRAIAVLRDAATEMERRLMAKREDQVILDNGDLGDYL